MIFDAEKFSITQMTSNPDGKTSASGTMSVLICVVGSFCFLLGCLDRIFFTHSTDILVQSIVFTSIGAGMLGYRKSQEKHLFTSESSPEIATETATETTTESEIPVDQPLNS